MKKIPEHGWKVYSDVAMSESNWVPVFSDKNESPPDGAWFDERQFLIDNRICMTTGCLNHTSRVFINDDGRFALCRECAAKLERASPPNVGHRVR